VSLWDTLGVPTQNTHNLIVWLGWYWVILEQQYRADLVILAFSRLVPKNQQKRPMNSLDIVELSCGSLGYTYQIVIENYSFLDRCGI
jgi:hypothetical protein